VTSLRDLALIDLQFVRLHATPGAEERAERALAATGAPVWLATHRDHGQAMSVVVPAAQADAVVEALNAALEREVTRGDLAPIAARRPVAPITLVAENICKTKNVAGRLFGALGRVGVKVYGIGQSATQRSVSAVVDEGALPVAVRTVHAAFHFGVERASLLVLGAGTVGGALLRQLHAQRPTLRADPALRVGPVGVDADHAAWGLRGSQAFIAFTTSR
jgi:aspartokinase/homoserine dehydrogenase 1